MSLSRKKSTKKNTVKTTDQSAAKPRKKRSKKPVVVNESDIRHSGRARKVNSKLECFVLEEKKPRKKSSSGGTWNRLAKNLNVTCTFKTRPDSSSEVKNSTTIPAATEPATTEAKLLSTPTRPKKPADKTKISPAEPFRKAIKTAKDYFSPAQTTAIGYSPNGTTITQLETKTIRKRRFDRMYSATITTDAHRKIDVEYYQEQTTILSPTKVKLASQEKLDEIKQTITRPVSDRYEVNVTITADSLEQKKKPRVYSHNKSASNVLAAFEKSFNKTARGNRSHACQNSVAQHEAKAVLTSEQKASGVVPDSYPTFDDLEHNNSERLTNAETPNMPKHIKNNGQLDYRCDIKLFKDSTGNIPIPEQSGAGWSKTDGSGIYYRSSFWNKPKPASGLRSINTKIADLLFGDASKNQADTDTTPATLTKK